MSNAIKTKNELIRNARGEYLQQLWNYAPLIQELAAGRAKLGGLDILLAELDGDKAFSKESLDMWRADIDEIEVLLTKAENFVEDQFCKWALDFAHDYYEAHDFKLVRMEAERNDN